MLMMEVNPMSVPVEQKYALDDNHAQAIDLLLQKAEKNEVQYFLLKVELEKRLSASELSLTQAKQMKNKEGEKQLKEEISLHRAYNYLKLLEPKTRKNEDILLFNLMEIADLYDYKVKHFTCFDSLRFRTLKPTILELIS